MKRKFNEIAEELQGMIDRGEYVDRLPSEQELAQIFDTATVTVRRALDVLLARGIIRKVPYVGTFVHRENRKKVRIAWRSNAFWAKENHEIQEAVKNHFKDFAVEFDPECDSSDVMDYDLIRSVATSTISFSDYVLPLPLEVVEKYQSEEYFQEPFKAHRINNFQYAMPILFSPSVFLLDRKKLEGFGRDIGPYDLTWDLLLELSEYARKNNFRLCALHEAGNLIRSMIFSDTENGGLNEIDVKKLRDKIHSAWPVLTDSSLKDDNREPLMTWSCRQGLLRLNMLENYLIVACPVFHQGEKPWNLITGEFLLLSNRSKVQPEAIQVMEYMLSADIQRIIGRSKTGLPILKAAAVDSINSRHYRDDIFLNEIPNMLVNNTSEQEFLLRLSSFLHSIFSGEMTEEQFGKCLEYEINMAHRKAASNNNNIWPQQVMELAGI